MHFKCVLIIEFPVGHAFSWRSDSGGVGSRDILAGFSPLILIYFVNACIYIDKWPIKLKLLISVLKWHNKIAHSINGSRVMIILKLKKWQRGACLGWEEMTIDGIAVIENGYFFRSQSMKSCLKYICNESNTLFKTIYWIKVCT
jgi:hypothetical protein